MRSTHGCVAARAVGRGGLRCYGCGMKPHYHRDPEAHRATDSTVGAHRSTRERGMHAVNARPPPAVLYRRYPSLSDDGQPYFPRLRRARRSADEKVNAVNRVNENTRAPFFSVRAFALLAIAVIIAALVASAMMQ